MILVGPDKVGVCYLGALVLVKINVSAARRRHRRYPRDGSPPNLSTMSFSVTHAIGLEYRCYLTAQEIPAADESNVVVL